MIKQKKTIMVWQGSQQSGRAGPVLASAWSGQRDTVHASPRPAGTSTFLASAWSGLGRLACYENEGDLMIH